jgi:PBP1b-binding outer membrane lipoprotein LpoB
MKYLAGIFLILVIFNGCNSDSTTQEVGSVNDAPQPTLKNSELQPPKPPSL